VKSPQSIISTHIFDFKKQKTGDWTDDTDQMILILDSLLEHNLQADRVDFAKRLYHWMDFGFEELGDAGGCGIGFTVHRVLTHKVFLEDPHEAARQIWEKYDKNLAANGMYCSFHFPPSL